MKKQRDRYKRTVPLSSFCAEILQILPAAVDFFLEEGQQVFIAGLKEVLEASLGTQEILDGKFVFGFVAQDPFAVIHFEEGPVAGLHCQ